MLRRIQRNVRYNEIPPHTCRNGYCQKIFKWQILARMWRKGNPLTLLVGIQIGTATMGTVYRFLEKKTKHKLKIILPYDVAIPPLSIYLKETKILIWKDTCTPTEGRKRRGWQRMRWLIASLTLWTWASSGSWWWTGKPGVLQPMGSQRVGRDWATELNCMHPNIHSSIICLSTDEWIKKMWYIGLAFSFTCIYTHTYTHNGIILQS